MKRRLDSTQSRAIAHAQTLGHSPQLSLMTLRAAEQNINYYRCVARLSLHECDSVRQGVDAHQYYTRVDYVTSLHTWSTNGVVCWKKLGGKDKIQEMAIFPQAAAKFPTAKLVLNLYPLQPPAPKFAEGESKTSNFGQTDR